MSDAPTSSASPPHPHPTKRKCDEGASAKSTLTAPTHQYTVTCDLTEEDGETGELRVVRFYHKEHALKFAHEQATYWANVWNQLCGYPLREIPVSPSGCYNNHGQKDPALADGYYQSLYDICVVESLVEFVEGEILMDTDNPRQHNLAQYPQLFPKDSVTFGLVYTDSKSESRPQPQNPSSATQHWTF